MLKPTALDLFAGCGGLTLGLKQGGFRVIGAIEQDPLAATTYRRNHRNTYVWQKDIRRVSAAEVLRRLNLRVGHLDLLAGCPPCEGFSRLRTLNGKLGVADPRNDLIYEFLRLARRIRPRAIMLENVPGLAKDRRMTDLLTSLEGVGYSLDVRILDASRYGVPQRRRRLIVLAGRFGPISYPPAASRRRTVRDAIGWLDRPGQSGDQLHDHGERRSPEVASLIRSVPIDGGSRLDLGAARQLPCHRRCDGFNDVYGRMAWDDVAPTITKGCVNPSKGRFLHPRQNRCITLREAALLQTFPPKYYVSLERGKYAAAAMIGNALPPEFVRHHACNVFSYLSATRKCGRS